MNTKDAWIAWVVGVDNNGPWRLFKTSEIPVQQRNRWKKLKILMRRIHGLLRQRSIDNCSVDSALQLYESIKNRIHIEGQHRQRHDQLYWITVLNILQRDDRAKRQQTENEE